MNVLVHVSIYVRCTGPKTIPVLFVDSRDSGLKIDVTESRLTKLHRSQANAVQHVEAGACPRCPGKEAARKGVYDFIARNQVWWSYFSSLGKTNKLKTLPYLESDLHCISGDKAHAIWPTAAWVPWGRNSICCPRPPLQVSPVSQEVQGHGRYDATSGLEEKTWIKTSCNFPGLCPPCCEPKIGPSLKEESSWPIQCVNVNVTENWSCPECFWFSWNCPLEIVLLKLNIHINFYHGAMTTFVYMNISSKVC